MSNAIDRLESTLIFDQFHRNAIDIVDDIDEPIRSAFIGQSVKFIGIRVIYQIIVGGGIVYVSGGDSGEISRSFGKPFAVVFQSVFKFLRVAR